MAPAWVGIGWLMMRNPPAFSTTERLMLMTVSA